MGDLEASTRPRQKPAVNIMTLLYLFLSLFVLQLFLVTPLVIGKEHVENREEPLSSEMKKTGSESSDKKMPPFLMMKKQESLDPEAQTERTKRDIQPNKANQEDDGCRKEDFIVHTKDFGLSTKFIHPQSFNAYQCKGQCALTPGKKFVNHSLLKAYLKKVKAVKTDGEACCVPTKLRPASFIYYTDKRGSFVMHTFQDMIVEECGCY